MGPRHEDLTRLRQSVMLLAEVHGRRLSDAALAQWVSSLSPYADRPSIWAAMTAACEAERMPSIGDVRASTIARSTSRTATTIAPMSRAERERADHAAVMSMLWLDRHHRGIGAGGILLSVMARQMGGADRATAAVAEARARYSDADVDAWMARQP